MRPPTGQQFTLTFRDGDRVHRARIAEVAAAPQTYTVDDLDLIEPNPLDRVPVKGQGIVMAPWPGRVAGGRWELDGLPRQLAVTEPENGNAIHGLLRYTGYRVLELEDHRVVLTATIHPQLGWPFIIDTMVEYALGSDGLSVTHTAVNASSVPAPWAVGAHPYLRVGDRPSSELTLTVPAARIYDVDERQIPTGTTPVDQVDGADLRAGRRVAELDLDAGFTELARDEHGRARSTLLADDGTGIELWQDEQFGCTVLFTPRDFTKIDGVGQAVAVEPMSAPANALNSGEGLVWLEPGESWTGSWGIRPIGL